MGQSKKTQGKLEAQADEKSITRGDPIPWQRKSETEQAKGNVYLGFRLGI